MLIARWAVWLILTAFTGAVCAGAGHHPNKKMIFTYEHLYSEEKNDWPGSDEPYVLVWAADLGTYPLNPLSVKTQVFHYAHGGVDPGEAHIANMRILGLDGGATAIPDPSRFIVLVAVLEEDDFPGPPQAAEIVKTALNPLAVMNYVNTYGWSAQSRPIIVEQLRKDMRAAIETLTALPGINTDDLTGDVFEFPIDPGFVLNAQQSAAGSYGEIWFAGSGFYKLSFRLTMSSENSAPLLKILEPANGSTFPPGVSNLVTFRAKVTDIEDGASCCHTVWTSSKDGYLGTGKKVEFAFTTTGARTITATATDSDGASTKSTITVHVAPNSPPSMKIVKPAPNQGLLFFGNSYTFEGSSFDVNEPGHVLPCSALKWTSSKPSDPFPLTGCLPQVKFPTSGPRTITLSGKDSQGASGSANVTVNVVGPPFSGVPVVTIDNVLGGDQIVASAIHSIAATATDSGGRGSIQWKWTVRYGSSEKTIGMGTSRSGQPFNMQWKPSDFVEPPECGRTPVKHYLYTSDGDGPPRAPKVVEIVLDTTC